MKIHHLNCVSSCPIGGYVMDGRTAKGLRGRLTCHCLLVEAGRSLVLVDTGYGLRDVAAPRARLSRTFRELLKPDLREEMTAIRQIQALGFDPLDVRHVVLTHLDFDHAGGLDDFPHARVHLLEPERAAAMARRTPLDRMRYRPQQWSTRGNWLTYEVPRGERWFDFECVRELVGAPEDVLLIPLFGHTLGHAGVAVRRERDWLLLAGDAYFYHAEMNVSAPSCTPGLRAYQRLMEKDRKQRLHNQARLRELKRAHGAEVTIICAHDVSEFERASGRRHNVPAGARPREPVPLPAYAQQDPAST